MNQCKKFLNIENKFKKFKNFSRAIAQKRRYGYFKSELLSPILSNTDFFAFFLVHFGGQKITISTVYEIENPHSILYHLNIGAN